MNIGGMKMSGEYMYRTKNQRTKMDLMIGEKIHRYSGQSILVAGLIKKMQQIS